MPGTVVGTWKMSNEWQFSTYFNQSCITPSCYSPVSLTVLALLGELREDTLCYYSILLYEYVLHSVMPISSIVGLKIRVRKGLLQHFKNSLGHLR